jgi:methionine-rich copper-binding protein CopC
MKTALRGLAFSAVALLAAMLPVERAAAHKPITSRHTYDHDFETDARAAT